MLEWILVLELFLVAMVVISWKLFADNRRLRFEKKSMSSRYGRMTEQFLPFSKKYPYNQENFRFIGTPIDGIQFEDDRIVMLEFKTGKSHLSEKQKRIRELVRKKRVDFEEIRI